MSKKTIIILAASVCAAVIIGAVLVFGNFFVRDPQVVLTRAFKKTMDEITAPEASLLGLYTRIKADAWRQEASFGVSRPGGSLLPDIDPRVLSVAEVVTLRHTARYNPDTQQRADNIAAQIAVATLVELDIQSDADEVAFRIPQAFDYFIKVNPRRIAGEWDSSLLGESLGRISGRILEDEFYDYYNRLIVREPLVDFDRLTEHIGILNEGAEYNYAGDNVYTVSIKKEALGAYWQAVKPQADWFDMGRLLRFDQDLLLYVTLANGKIAGLTFETGVNDLPLVGIVRLNVSPDVLEARIMLDVAGLEGSLDVYWDKASPTRDNFRLETALQYESVSVSLLVSGALNADFVNHQIEAHIREAALAVDLPFGGLEGSISGRYMLKPDAQPVTFDEERRSLTSINMLDVLAMTGKLMSHPLLGEYLSGLLPF